MQFHTLLISHWPEFTNYYYYYFYNKYFIEKTKEDYKSAQSLTLEQTHGGIMAISREPKALNLTHQAAKL